VGDNNFTNFPQDLVNKSFGGQIGLLLVGFSLMCFGYAKLVQTSGAAASWAH
jgi:hypothetical protein